MTTDNPGMDISAALRAWQPGSLDPEAHSSTTRGPRWVPICMCGHPVMTHGDGYGGTRTGDEVISFAVVHPPCTGPIFRNPLRVNPAWEKGSDQPQSLYATKCFCEGFTPIAEVDRPAVAFRRMPHPVDHAFTTGIRALRATVRNRGVQDPDLPLRSKKRLTPTEEQLDEIIAQRFRWLIADDERRCASCGTSSTANPLIFPVYSGLPLGKVSEFRCTDCRPSA